MSTNETAQAGAEQPDAPIIDDDAVVDAAIAQRNAELRAALDRMFPGQPANRSPGGWGGGTFSSGNDHGFGC